MEAELTTYVGSVVYYQRALNHMISTDGLSVSAKATAVAVLVETLRGQSPPATAMEAHRQLLATGEDVVRLLGAAAARGKMVATFQAALEELTHITADTTTRLLEQLTRETPKQDGLPGRDVTLPLGSSPV